MEKISYRIARKSLDATLSALELYNKPDFKYREETFCILMVNAYELLFKAKILLDNKDRINSLYIYDNKKGKDGNVLKQKIIRKNRINQPYTIDINKCMNILYSQGNISNNLCDNINMLIEIRDNAIHLLNKKSNIKERIYSICAASIKNYSKLFEKWFKKININQYNFFITPLNFDTLSKNYDTLNTSVAERNLLSYIDNAITESSSYSDEYDLLVNVDIKFTKSTVDAVLLKYANEGKKINVELNYETFKKMFPFTNSQIIQMLKEKQKDFKIGKKFNDIKKRLQEMEICCRPWYPDVNQKGKPRYYYNSNFVIKVLDEYNSKK